MKKLLMVLLILTCAFSCFSVAYGIAPPPIIDGNIYLPDGKVAPPGGITLKVTAEIPGNAQTSEITISEGQNSAPYGFRILSMYGGLEIRCELITPVEGYYDVSYYTGISQKPFKSDAVKLTDMCNQSDLNITLVESKKVTGEIILPDGVSLENDSSVNVTFTAQSEPNTAVGSASKTDINFSKEVTAVIEKGEKSGTFEVELPVYSEGYYYNYKLIDYISGICPDSNKFDASNKLLEASKISMTLDKGNIITGVVTLPKGKVAEKDLSVKIRAFYFTSTSDDPKNVLAFTDRDFTIPEGKNSIDYEIAVYPEYSKYYIGYSLNTNKYINKGYYSPTGTVTKIDRDKCAVNVDKNIKDLNLPVLNGATLSGKLMCPEGNASEDIEGVLALYNDYYFADYPFVINKGSSSITFDFNLPTDLGSFAFRYETKSTKYENMAYYNDNGTTLDQSYCINVNDGTTKNVQFYLLENQKISGNISLPEDMETPTTRQEYEIAALVKTEYDTYTKIASAISYLEPSKRSTSFELFVPDEYDEVIVSCSIINNDPLVLDSYLAEDGMVLDSTKAKVINPGKPGSSGLELVPFRGVRISGVIKVGQNYSYVQKCEQTYLQFIFLDENGEHWSKYFEIKWENPESNSQEFFVNVPSIDVTEKFKIVLAPGMLVGDRFYAGEEGVTTDPDKAKIFTYDGVDLNNLVINFGKAPSPVISYGDVNGDGNINAIDFAKLRFYLLGKIGEDGINIENSDLDLNGEINAIDFAYLRKYLLGIIDKLPIAK